MKLILADTVELMNSEDYRDRFVAEYIQTKIRYEKLKDFNTKIEASARTRGLDNGVDEPIHACPAGLLREQQAAMGEYLYLLEVRAKIEDIDLEDAIQYFSDKKRDRERIAIDETATVENANTVSFGEKEAFEQVLEERREEIKFELSVCANCVHYPICKHLTSPLVNFKLPRKKQSCDLFESVNSCGEEKSQGNVCENEAAKPAKELPEGVMSLDELLEVLMRCGDKTNETRDGCPLYDSNCRDVIYESAIYYLVLYKETCRR